MKRLQIFTRHTGDQSRFSKTMKLGRKAPGAQTTLKSGVQSATVRISVSLSDFVDSDGEGSRIVLTVAGTSSECPRVLLHQFHGDACIYPPSTIEAMPHLWLSGMAAWKPRERCGYLKDLCSSNKRCLTNGRKISIGAHCPGTDLIPEAIAANDGRDRSHSGRMKKRALTSSNPYKSVRGCWGYTQSIAHTGIIPGSTHAKGSLDRL